MPRQKQCQYNCGRPVERKHSDMCHACYQAIQRWSKKTPTQMVARQKQLKVFERRLEALTNVTPLSRKRIG